jgi:hypothetical protein
MILAVGRVVALLVRHVKQELVMPSNFFVIGTSVSGEIISG